MHSFADALACDHLSECLEGKEIKHIIKYH